MVLGVALVAACATPYQQMGFRGGYQDQPLGEGRYLIEVKVNGYTSAGTAMGYLHRRSAEVCKAAGYRDYVFEDAAADASYVTVRTGNTLQTVSKPERSAIIRCTRPRRRARRAKPAQGWWCSDPVNQAGPRPCYPTKAICDESSRELNAPMSACYEQLYAACLSYVDEESGGEGRMCFANLASCESMIDYIERNGERMSIASGCQRRSR